MEPMGICNTIPEVRKKLLYQMNHANLKHRVAK